MRENAIGLRAVTLALALGAWTGCTGGGGSPAPPGFRLDVDPNELLVVIGRATDGTIAVSPAGGFEGDVDLSAAAVPAGLTVTLDPTTVARANGRSRLRVAAAPAASPGRYALAVRGTSRAITVDRTVAVNVVRLPADRFRLAPDVSTVAVPPGTRGDTTLRVTPVGEFRAPVALAVVNAPEGIAATLQPAAGPGGDGTAALALAVGGNVAPGAYRLTLRATGGGYSESVPFALLVPPAPTAAGLTLSAPPATAVPAGGTTVVQVGVARDPGVTGGVTLSAVDPPPGLTARFEATPCLTAGSLLTLRAEARLAPGVYPLTVRGEDGTRTGTTGLLVEVVPAEHTADAWISRVELGQTYLGDAVRLVPGKPALVRAHVLADAGSVTSPRVLLTATRGASPLGTLALAGPSTLPVREDPATLAASFTGDLPAAWVADGLSLRLEVDPDHTLAERNELNNAVRIQPAVAPATRLDLVVVPIILDGRTGSVPDLHGILYRHWPLQQVTISVRTPYAVTSVPKVKASGEGWSQVLSEIANLRQADNASAHYYGVIKTDYRAGVTGMGYIGYPVAVGVDRSPAVASHELGHNFGLHHAPCGGAPGVDTGYPYPSAMIGTWGYDAGAGILLAPASTRDIMSYCSPPWVSDYNYRKVHRWLEPQGAKPVPAPPPRPALLVSGTIAGETVRLNPLSRVVRAIPLHPRGRHWLTVVSAAGRAVSPFTPLAIGCGPAAGRVSHFMVVLPDPGPLRVLTIQRGSRTLVRWRAPARAAPPASAVPLALEERGGRLQVTWDHSAFSHLTVTHVGHRRTTLALWRTGGRTSLSLAGVPAGGHFEVNLANGLEVKRVIVRR